MSKKESPFVAIAMKVAEQILAPPLCIERSAALLYQITVDNRLAITVDVRQPKRGQSAYQTDLCVFEQVAEGIKIPRVVLEFKTGISTHDVLTYSAKASKHKQVYPYLRYGIVSSNEPRVPGRLFTHNDSLDFCLCTTGLSDSALRKIIAELLENEVAASRQLEAIAFEKVNTRMFRKELVLMK